MFPGKMTCPYRPAASATASAMPGLPCPAPWVHHDAHASTNARCETRTCGKAKAARPQQCLQHSIQREKRGHTAVVSNFAVLVTVLSCVSSWPRRLIDFQATAATKDEKKLAVKRFGYPSPSLRRADE